MEIPKIVIPPIQKIKTVEIPLPTADVPYYVPLVVPPSDLDSKVDEIAAKAAAGPPRALALSKAMLNRSFENSLTDALDQEGTSQTFNFTTKDISEAMRAFIEKRNPDFKGW